MRNLVRSIVLAAAAACLPSMAQAKVHITVDLDRQTMHVESNDRVFDWKVSSGKSGYDTPPGTYGVLWMDKDHLSDEYNQTPMPNAIFFKPGFAIHGATRSAFGRPASHGCVRLPVAKSAILFSLVKAEGAEIRIVGGNAAPRTIEASSRRPRAADEAAPAVEYDAPPRYAAVPQESAAQPQPQPAPQPVQGLGAPFSGLY